MGILAILAGLAVWHGLARYVCRHETGGWGMDNAYEVVFSHLVAGFAMGLAAIAGKAIGPINWPAVWHWLLWME